MIVLRLDPAAPIRPTLHQVALAMLTHPGEHSIRLLVEDRQLDLGPAWNCDGSSGCLERLRELGEIIE